MKYINKDEIENIAKAIKIGQVVAFPSDTCFGLATNPLNQFALEKMFQIKGRDMGKKISLIFKDINQIKTYTNLSQWQERFLMLNLPGPFTFLLSPNENFLSKFPLYFHGEKIGVRIPDFLFTKNLSLALDIPFTSTSANISGNKELYTSVGVYKEFFGKNNSPDFVVSSATLLETPPSSVILLKENNFEIIRDGKYKINIP